MSRNGIKFVLKKMAYYCSNYSDFIRSHVHGIHIYVTHGKPVDIDVRQEVFASNPERRMTLLKGIVFKKRITKGPNTFTEREFNNSVKLRRCIASTWEGD
jgi:hypothetical protein